MSSTLHAIQDIIREEFEQSLLPWNIFEYQCQDETGFAYYFVWVTFTHPITQAVKTGTRIVKRFDVIDRPVW